MPVYMIRAGENGPVKIGVTDDVGKRLRNMQTGNSERLSVLRVFEGSADEERRLHARFLSLRLRGEWFHFSPELLDDLGLVEIPTLVAAPEPEPIIVRDNPVLFTAAEIEERGRRIGISIATICERAKIALSTFYRWRSGDTEPRLDVYGRLKDVTEPPVAA
jgi:hypothetical protein